MNSGIIESLRFSIKKAIQYRANLVSWFLADIALYTAIFLAYYLLTQEINTFGDYSREEVLLYISCFFLINNLFAIFFSEAVSHFGHTILTGYFDFYLLKPQSIMKSFILRNLNFPASLSTVMLLILNVYCFRLCNIKLSLQYIISTCSATILMGLLFFIIYSLMLFNIRSEVISGVILQFLSVAEKPDTVFPKFIRNLLTYVVPVFLFSAVPTRIALGKSMVIEEIWLYSSPVIYYLIWKVILIYGLKKYQSGVS